MGQVCRICVHPQRLKIDKRLVSGANITAIAREFGLPYHTLARHRKKHLTRQLVKANELKELKNIRNLAKIMDEGLGDVVDIKDIALKDEKYKLALKALGELRNYSETFVRIEQLINTERDKQNAEAKRRQIEALKQLPSYELQQFSRILSNLEGDNNVIDVTDIAPHFLDRYEDDESVIKAKKRKRKKIRTRIELDDSSDDNNFDEDYDFKNDPDFADYDFGEDDEEEDERDIEGFTEAERNIPPSLRSIANADLVRIKRARERDQKLTRKRPKTFLDDAIPGTVRVKVLGE